MIRTLFLSCILCFVTGLTNGQETKADTLLATAVQVADLILYQNHDTSYIKSYADKISVKILANNKFNTFALRNPSLDKSILYRPDLGVNLGIGATYKWFALDISTSLGFKEENISNSIYRDIQGRILTSKHYLRFRYQYYLGYKIDDLSGLNIDQSEEYETRQDIRTLQFGMQYLYAFNYGKFSLKAPFAMNEKQRKSAGSFIAGLGFQMYTLDADSSLIPSDSASMSPEENSFSELNMVSLTANYGYMYSFVIKGRFFITLGLIPGIGIKSGDYRVGDRVPIESPLVLMAKTMNAMGYNGNRFFGGIQLISSFYFMPLEQNLKFNMVEGRSALYVGYRF